MQASRVAFALATTAAVLLVAGSPATAPAQLPKTNRTFKTPAAGTAKAAFTTAVASAKKAYSQALDAALKNAMTGGDLGEANSINAFKTALDAGSDLPMAEFKSSGATQAKNAYDAAIVRTRSQYATVLENAKKTALASRDLKEANAIQDELAEVTSAPKVQEVAGSLNESADLIVSGKGFAMASLLDNVPAFNNRAFVWKEIPTALKGFRYTKANGGGRPEIKVRAKRDTTVQVFTDLTDPGVKLLGWDRTGFHFTYDNGKNPNIVMFKKKLAAGQELDIPQGNWCGVLVLLPPEK